MYTAQDYDEGYYMGKKGAYANYQYAETWRERARGLLGVYPDAQSFMDVGCAKGFLLRGYVENGVNPCTVNGIDISAWATTMADPLVKDRLQCMSILDAGREIKERYDLVTAFDFLEHFCCYSLPGVVDLVAGLARKYLVVACMTRKVDWDKDKTHQCILPIERWREILQNGTGMKITREAPIAEHVVYAYLTREGESEWTIM